MQVKFFSSLIINFFRYDFGVYINFKVDWVIQIAKGQDGTETIFLNGKIKTVINFF